jgi:hypothetical protein
MRVRIRFLPFVVLPFLVGCAKWKDYTSTEGNFTCKLPGKVKIETKTLSLPTGTITVTSHLTRKGNQEFGVAVFDLPPGTPFNLDGGVEGAVRAVAGKVTSKKACTVDGIAGIEFECDATTPRTTQVVSRIFVHKGRAYQLVALGNKFRADTKQVQDFFDSFKLLKK